MHDAIQEQLSSSQNNMFTRFLYLKYNTSVIIHVITLIIFIVR